MYETDIIASQYCEFHYGSEYFGVKNFPKSIVNIVLPYVNNKSKALDIGCSVGRASFELKKEFDVVDGLDYSNKFIQIANQMKEDKLLKYTNTSEGECTYVSQTSLEDLSLDINTKDLNFYQADAMNMKKEFKEYDLIIAVNLIDRLHTPLDFLNNISLRLNPNGILLIASPYTWLCEYTPKENWLGGYTKDGKDIKTIYGLHKALDDKFELIKEDKIEFVIRETQNKYQHTVSKVSIWKLR